MFKQISNGYVIPEPGSVEGMNIAMANRGGGYIVTLIVRGRPETMVFTSLEILTTTLVTMLNSAALAQLATAAPKAESVKLAKQSRSGVGETVVAKRKGGRPKGSRNKPKVNGADTSTISETAIAA